MPKPHPHRPAGGRSDAIRVGLSQLWAGISIFVFLTVTTRAVGAVRFAPMSIVWSALFIVGAGLFQPVEAQSSKDIAERVVSGDPFGSVVTTARRTSGAFYLGVVVVAAAIAPFVMASEFDSSWLTYVALVVGIGGFAMTFSARGALTATLRYGDYATWFIVDGAVKIIGSVALAAFGVDTIGPYAVVLCGSTVLAALVSQVEVGEPEPGPPTLDFLPNISHLLAASMLTAFLINAGPVTVALLATPLQRATATHFLTALVIMRIPLFFFASVQSALVPELTRLIRGDDRTAFRRALIRLCGGLAALTVVGTIGAALIGPFVITLLYGPAYDELSRLDLALLAASTLILLGALALAQALVALGRQSVVKWAWLVGCITFVGVVAAGTGLVTRVSIALLASSITTTAAMAWFASRPSDHVSQHAPDPVER